MNKLSHYASHGAFLARRLPDELTKPRRNKLLNASQSSRFVDHYAQQDAHEFFQLISSRVSTEAESILQFSKHSRGLIDILRPALSTQRDISHFRSLTNPFSGLVASRFACMDCGYLAAIRNFSFDNLSLVIPPVSQTLRGMGMSFVNLGACLDEYTKVEFLPDAVCRRCRLVATLAMLDRSIEISKEKRENKARQKLKKRQQLSENHEQEKAATDELDSESLKPTRSELRQMKAREKVADALEFDPEREIEDQYDENDPDDEPVRLADPDQMNTVLRFLEPEKIRLGCTKQTMLARLPAVLCLHINRSDFFASGWGDEGFAQKNMTRVKFPHCLDMSPWTLKGLVNTDPRQSMLDVAQHSKTSSDDASMKYVLRAVVVHYGTHHDGHFVAFVSRRQKKVKTEMISVLPLVNGTSSNLALKDEAKHEWIVSWWRISDDQRSQVSLDDVLAENPYLLFYERCDSSDVELQDEMENEQGSNEIHLTGKRQEQKLASKNANKDVYLSSSETEDWDEDEIRADERKGWFRRRRNQDYTSSEDENEID